MRGSLWRKAVVLTMIGLFLGAFSVPAAGFLSGPRPQPAPSPWRWVASVSALPEDRPQLCSLWHSRRDAWTLHREKDEGKVFLVRRPGEPAVVAFASYHMSGHLRIGVVFDEEKGMFRSVCRKVLFDLEGRLQETDPFTRMVADDLVSLDVKVEGGEVFVLPGPPDGPRP